MTSDGVDGAVIDTASTGSRPRLGEPTTRSQRNRVLRILGALALIYSLALLVVPPGYLNRGFGGSGCGVPLQALFHPPGTSCVGVAYTQAAKSGAYAVVAVALLGFSGIRRRLRFLGLTALGLSAYPMLFSTSEFQPVEGPGFAHVCGSAIGDLVRRGYTEVTFGGGSGPLSPLCGDRALSRLYLTLGIAAVGAVILIVDAIRRRNAEPVVG